MSSMNLHVLALGDGACFCSSTRLGGVSEPPFDTLNLSPDLKDDAGAVKENQRRLAGYCGVDPEQIHTGRQVHGTRVIQVDPEQPARREGDALITDSDQVVPGIFTADCFPIGLADQAGRIRCVVHAGWRGTMAGVISSAIRNLEALGSKPAQLRAVVGPGIGPCCYRVGRTVLDDLRSSGLSSRRFIRKRDGGTWLDLRRVIHHRLLEAGLIDRSVQHLDLCTSCRDDLFFSHRRDHGAAGRMLSLVLPLPADRLPRQEA